MPLRRWRVSCLERNDSIMTIKRPKRNILISYKDFSLVKVTLKEKHRVKKNELILPRREDRNYDVKLIWFATDEEMVFLRGHFNMFVPRCYYEHILAWRMALRFYNDGNWSWHETDEEKEQKREWCDKLNISPQMASIAWRHTKNKRVIFTAIQNMEIYNELFFMMEKVYSLEEIIQAVNDIPFLPTWESKWEQSEPIDAITQKLIEAQIVDNKNANKGIISYECLKSYDKCKLWIHWTDVDETRAFIIRQYEAKQKKKGLEHHLESEEYIKIIESMKIESRYVIGKSKT